MCPAQTGIMFHLAARTERPSKPRARRHDLTFKVCSVVTLVAAPFAVHLAAKRKSLTKHPNLAYIPR
jgi:hypothetical protein